LHNSPMLSSPARLALYSKVKCGTLNSSKLRRAGA
jgi:hypothetical protein